MLGNSSTGNIDNLSSVLKNIKIEGNWVSGISRDGKFRVEAKTFATGSNFGINGGRISKIGIVPNEGNRDDWSNRVVSYERGWDVKPKTKIVQKLLDNILTAVDK